MFLWLSYIYQAKSLELRCASNGHPLPRPIWPPLSAMLWQPARPVVSNLSPNPTWRFQRCQSGSERAVSFQSGEGEDEVNMRKLNMQHDVYWCFAKKTKWNSVDFAKKHLDRPRVIFVQQVTDYTSEFCGTFTLWFPANIPFINLSVAGEAGWWSSTEKTARRKSAFDGIFRRNTSFRSLENVEVVNRFPLIDEGCSNLL